MSEKILDIEKIGEKGKIEISHLKLILKELLEELKVEAQRNDDFKIDLSIMLGVLFDKGLISKDEYEELKDKVGSLIDSEIIESALGDEITDDMKEEIVRKSYFKGFFSSYEELINALPISKSKHGDFAYVKDFEAGRYDINDITEYIFDIRSSKWMSGTDETLLRNYQERDDINENGEPENKDILIYNNIVKRWFAVSFDEADIARKSVLTAHLTDRVLLEKDDVSINEEAKNNDGRLMVMSDDNSNPLRHPSHISNADVKRLIQQINDDYFKTIEIGFITDELGVERIFVDGEDEDKYKNDIYKNISNKTLRTIIDKIYENLDRTFNIEIDEETKRIINLNYVTPEEYITRLIRTYDVDKIISRINDDYYNTFEFKDFIQKSYLEILTNTISEYKDTINLPEEEIESIINRLNSKNSSQTGSILKNGYNDYEKNKNLSVEVMDRMISTLNFLKVYLDINRDEIMERDISINGNKTFTGDILLTNEKKFESDAAETSFTNKNGVVNISNKFININNAESEVNVKSNKIDITNSESVVNLDSKEVNLTNKESVLKTEGNLHVEGDVTFKGNLYIADTSSLVEVNAEKVTYKDNVLVLNNGEQGDGVTFGISGFIVDRGSYKDYFFGFDEKRDEFVSGKISEETQEEVNLLNAVLNRANREELEHEKVFVWNSDSDRAETRDNVVIDIKGCINFYTLVPNHTFNLLDVVRVTEEGSLILASCNTVEESDCVGVVVKIESEKVYVATSGYIPLKLSSAKTGDSLYLQKDGTLSNNGYNVVTKYVGIQIEDGIIINIQRTEKINNSYTSYQTNEGDIKKFDVVYIGDEGKLVKSSSEDINTSEALGVVSEVRTNYIKVITSGFVEGVFEEIEGSTLFLQHDGSISNSKENNVEKAIATKVNNGIYVDIKLGIKRVEIPGANEYDILPDNQTLFEITSSEVFSPCDFLSISNGSYVKFDKVRTTPVAIVVKSMITGEGNKYLISRSNFISKDLLSLEKFKNHLGINTKIGDKLYFGENFNNLTGEHCIGEFCEYGFNFSYSKKVVEQTKTYGSGSKTLNKDKYYRIKTEKQSINCLEIFNVDSPRFAKVDLINNNSLNNNNLFASLNTGTYFFSLYKHNGDFIIKSEYDFVVKGQLYIEETTLTEDFVSINF